VFACVVVGIRLKVFAPGDVSLRMQAVTLCSRIGRARPSSSSANRAAEYRLTRWRPRGSGQSGRDGAVNRGDARDPGFPTTVTLGSARFLVAWRRWEAGSRGVYSDQLELRLGQSRGLAVKIMKNLNHRPADGEVPGRGPPRSGVLHGICRVVMCRRAPGPDQPIDR
jgi:hypothetical protein